MKRILSLLLICALLCPAAALALVERSPVLDTAFSLLEEGNLFLTRYNQLTGADVQTCFPYGVPYFYGGTKASTVFSKAPEYVAIKAWTSSPLYYKADTQYIMGFDCGGFSHYVCQNSGLTDHDKLSAMLSQQYCDRHRHLFCTEHDNMPALDKLHQYLQPGDLLVARRGSGYHIMCYVGTLRDYAVTAEEYPELAPWLDDPLVIHCSAHPAFGERFLEKVIKTNRSRYGACQTTDGGVAVSLLCYDISIAPESGVMQKQEHHWFTMDDGNLLLNVIDLPHYEQYAWLRMAPAK